MSSEILEPSAETAVDSEEYQNYRSICAAAVASTALGLASVGAFFAWALLLLPVLGLVTGIYALRQVRSRADELTGLGLAKFGIYSSIFCFVAGASLLSYEYATEVPPGHDRISYEDLQPDPDRPSQVIPPSALALDGKKVFIKGYVYPSKKMDNIKSFILCRDQGDCCFGGNPKLTDRIQVTLMRGQRLEYSSRLFKLAGVFHVTQYLTPATGMDGGVVYYLDADMLK
jgi:hypothetical protein